MNVHRLSPYRLLSILMVGLMVTFGLTALQMTVGAQKASALTCGYSSSSGDVLSCTDDGGGAFNPIETPTKTTGTGPGSTTGSNPPPGTEGWDYVACAGWGGGVFGGGGYENGGAPLANGYPIGEGKRCSLTPNPTGSYKTCEAVGTNSATGAYFKWTRKNGTAPKEFSGTFSCAYPGTPFTRHLSTTLSGDCIVSIQLYLYYSDVPSTIRNTSANGGLGGGSYEGKSALSRTSPAFNYDNVQPTCKQTVTANWNKNLPTDANGSLKGYYRVTSQILYVHCDAYVPDAGAKGATTEWKCTPKKGQTPSTKYSYKYYTNDCNSRVTNGVDDNAEFDPSQCAKNPGGGEPGDGWTCRTGDISINGTTAATRVTRSGADLSTVFPDLTVNGNGWARNVTNVKHTAEVDTDEVSPMYGSNPNDDKQFFKLFNTNHTTRLSFNTGTKYAMTGYKNTYLQFYWASDSGSPWSMSAKYTFTAEFKNVNNTNLGGASTTRWVTDSAQCDDVATSGNVNVLRSVNTPQ